MRDGRAGGGLGGMQKTPPAGDAAAKPADPGDPPGGAGEKNFTTQLPRTTLGTGLARTGTNWREEFSVKVYLFKVGHAGGGN